MYVKTHACKCDAKRNIKTPAFNSAGTLSNKLLSEDLLPENYVSQITSEMANIFADRIQNGNPDCHLKIY